MIAFGQGRSCTRLPASGPLVTVKPSQNRITRSPRVNPFRCQFGLRAGFLAAFAVAFFLTGLAPGPRAPISGASACPAAADGALPAHQVVSGSKLTQHASPRAVRSEEHTSEHQSLMRISYAVFCLKKKNKR